MECLATMKHDAIQRRNLHLACPGLQNLTTPVGSEWQALKDSLDADQVVYHTHDRKLKHSSHLRIPRLLLTRDH
jgi:hypothetical protein